MQQVSYLAVLLRRVLYHGSSTSTIGIATGTRVRTYVVRTYVRTRVRTYMAIMLCHNFLIGKGHTCALRTTCVLGVHVYQWYQKV